MMDISDASIGPIVEREGVKKDFETRANETSEDIIIDDDPIRPGHGIRCPKNLKRTLDEDLMNSKKRRKQLKPIRIATNLEDMVKVPKQIIGLNNDLDDNVTDLPYTVPEELSSKSLNSPKLLDDVHFSSPLQSESSTGQKINKAPIDSSRVIDKPEITDINVPNIEAGPNYIANPHFMFPLSFQAVKNPNFWSESSLKIFNQEAYCELCKKEFCNKYFLKTHKANKHGIYVDMPGSSTARLSTKSDTKENVKISENGRTLSDDCATAFCDLCNKKFCNKYFVKRHKSKSHGLVEDEVHVSVFSCHDPESKAVQNSSHNSTKETESTLKPEPLALVSKENDQDNQIKNKSSQEQEAPLNLIVNVSAKEDSDGEPIVEEKDENEEEEKEQDKSEEVAEEDGDECSSENIEKLQTMLLRLNPSEIESKTCRVCNELVENAAEHKCPFEKKEKDKEYLSEGNDSSSESKNELGVHKTENNEYVYVNRLDHMKQMKPTSSYCEICNKELCNKYFMRTHMQRMHGIEIEHGTQIGGVVCNICNKELCSKYFLRVHKQNTHGIMSPNSLIAPSTSSNLPTPTRQEPRGSRPDPRFFSNFPQVCCICNKRFRSPKWLQAHIMSDHREETTKTETTETLDEDSKEDDSKSALKIPKKNSGLPTESKEPPEAVDVISKIFWENNPTSKTYHCSQCPFTTSVLAFLFVHERSHFVLAQGQSEIIKPSASLQNLIHNKTFWQHKITQKIPECLDLSAASKPKCVTFESNGS